MKEHRQLSKQLRDIEHEIRDCQAASYDQAKARGSPVTMRRRSGGMTTGEQDMHAVKRTQKIQKVRLVPIIRMRYCLASQSQS